MTAKIKFSWVTIRPSDQPPRVECHWALIGANGEHMCGSYPEGYRDKADARRALAQAVAALTGGRTLDTLKSEGPGPKPGDADDRG
jgi:hypothetical protein